MKKSLLSLLIASLLIVTVNAQEVEPKHELFAGYGLAGTSAVIEIFSDLLATSITSGGYQKKNVYWSGNFHAGYKFLPSKHTAVGLTYAYVKSSGDILFETKKGSIEHAYNTAAGEFDFRYINNPYFKLYSSIGAGLTLYREKYEVPSKSAEINYKTHFNFQFSPIGIKFGNSVGAFAELGFGYKGVIHAGVFASF
ncbi:MAG: hypothetical protein LBS07_03620 [Prevotellaceae bacterium]|jgi:hypothetical protein|nr:hypothetical protein [Prevotellaceae bacterium]